MDTRPKQAIICYFRSYRIKVYTKRSASWSDEPIEGYLREFPTPVILDQARERVALNGKIEVSRNGSREMRHAQFQGLARNGGHGSIEETEIFHFRPTRFRSAMIWGSVILRLCGGKMRHEHG